MNQTKRPLGLYLHIPFCRSKCIYCDFYSLAGQEEQMDRYTAALCAHLTRTAPSAAGYRVDTVYIGGGTPTLLGPRRLEQILHTVHRCYDVAAEAEITLEANPESARDRQALEQLRRAGVNRISLGVQSADNGVLRAIGRIHTWEQAVSAVEAVRRAEIGNLSVDLIYGLPGQTAAQWQDTVEKVLSLEVQHISCYGLKVEEGTPLFRLRDSLTLPDDDGQADMYLWAVEALARRGYAQYEISNFAREGMRSRHNMKYWTLGEYVGFGPGAHSDFGGVRYAYARDLEGYISGAPEGTLQVSEAERIPPHQRDTEYIMLSLRTAEGISAPAFEQTYRRPFAPLEQVLKKYGRAGCAVRTDSGWRLTPEGFLLSNAVISDLWEALETEKNRRPQTARDGFPALP